LKVPQRFVLVGRPTNQGLALDLPATAAERRQTVATAEGRGLRVQASEPRSGERLFRRSAAQRFLVPMTTAFCRGYNLPPLRG